MGLSKKYFINKDHINDMKKLSEEIHFNIQHLEDTIRNQNRAVEAKGFLKIIEIHRAYIDSIKAQRTAVQLLRDLSFILDHYIDEMKEYFINKDHINGMKELSEEIHFNIQHLEQTIKNLNRAVEAEVFLEIIEIHRAHIDSIKAQRTSVELLRDLNFILGNYIDQMKEINLS